MISMCATVQVLASTLLKKSGEIALVSVICQVLRHTVQGLWCQRVLQDY